MKLGLALGFLFMVFLSVEQPAGEAPAGFDDKSNGMVDEPTHEADREAFDDVEGVEDGLGPLYNAQSCRECHQNPTSGGASQITEPTMAMRTTALRTRVIQRLRLKARSPTEESGASAPPRLRVRIDTRSSSLLTPCPPSPFAT